MWLYRGDDSVTDPVLRRARITESRVSAGIRQKDGFRELFDRYGLGKVSWLVHVEAVQAGHVVGEELEREDCE